MTPTASTATTQTGQGWVDATGTPLVDADRALPWVMRNHDWIYPVKVPNAYDRIYIFPIYTIEARATSSLRLTVDNAINAAVLPFGLFPETRRHTTSNTLVDTGSRFPDDLMDRLLIADPVESTAPLAVSNLPSTRTNGIWNVLPPYSANFTTSHFTNTNSEVSPSHIARSTVGTNGKIGSAYKLPSDSSISKSTTTVYQSTNSRITTGPVVVGQGLEFQTLGTEEIVAVPVMAPATITWTVPAVGDKFRLHWFLMGVFLG
jgi:hypothetical protein